MPKKYLHARINQAGKRTPIDANDPLNLPGETVNFVSCLLCPTDKNDWDGEGGPFIDSKYHLGIDYEMNSEYHNQDHSPIGIVYVLEVDEKKYEAIHSSVNYPREVRDKSLYYSQRWDERQLRRYSYSLKKSEFNVIAVYQCDFKKNLCECHIRENFNDRAKYKFITSAENHFGADDVSLNIIPVKTKYELQPESLPLPFFAKSETPKVPTQDDIPCQQIKTHF